MKKSDFIFSVEELKNYLQEKKCNLKKIIFPDYSENNFFLQIPKYYADLVNWYDHNDPLRKMVATNKLENNVKDYELEDPIGDKLYTTVPGIIHRHQNRCLLNLTNVCAVHCRFCFRRNLLSKTKEDFEKCLGYIKTHNEIWEVILSGGDPFMLTNHFFERVISELKKINHIKLIRFHTRTPVVYPQRVDKDFINILEKAGRFTVVFHINHPREITSEFIKVVNQLKKKGGFLLSQSVLLNGVNNSSLTLETLFRGLVEIGIKPYYLYHPDLVQGTTHFRVSIEEGKQIMRDLHEKMSGSCLPEYAVDIPGGCGKIPVSQLQCISSKKYKTIVNNKEIMYTDYSS